MCLEPHWHDFKEDGLLIRIHAQPKASRSEVVGLHGGRIKIKLAAPPVDGEANRELLRFLKKELRVTFKDLEITRGLNSKIKDVFCRNIDREFVDKVLKSWVK